MRTESIQSITFLQADLLRKTLLENYFSNKENENEIGSKWNKDSTKIPDAKGRKIVKYFKEKVNNLDLGDKAFREDFIQLFWDKDGNRQKNKNGSVVEDNVISIKQLIKLGRCAYPDIYKEAKSEEFMRLLLQKLSSSTPQGVVPKKTDLVRKGGYHLFYHKDIDGAEVAHHPVVFSGTKHIEIITDDSKEPYKGMYRRFNGEERYLLFRFQRAGKDDWNMIFDLGHESNKEVPEIILGSSYRFSRDIELTSGVVVLAKISDSDLGNLERVKSSVSKFLDRDEYAPIVIPNRFFKNVSSLEEWLRRNTKKPKSLDFQYLKNITGKYVYFACKVPVAKGAEYPQIIKAILEIKSDGSVTFDGPDNSGISHSFEGEYQYSTSNEVLQINLYEETREKFLTLQAYLSEDRLKRELINSPIIGISIWKDKYLEGKIMALLPKHDNDNGQDLGILSIEPTRTNAYGTLINNDLLYNGVISYLSGKINRYIYTPKRFHEGPFRPHKKWHRETYFGMAYYLATHCKPKPNDESDKIEAWEIKVQSALREAYLHGFASNVFAGVPIEKAIVQAKRKIDLEGKTEPLHAELAEQLAEILEEQIELKTCLSNEMKPFYEFAKRYWPNLDKWSTLPR